MIVKNESKIIERLLSSVAPVIDTYCICDTGSNDNTVEVITSFFNNLGIEGRIVSSPFINFEQSRNFALSSAAGMADYLLLLDADMCLDVKKFDKSKLSEYYSYSILQGSEDFYYYNRRIVKNDGRSKYLGVTHEYLSTPEGIVEKEFPKEEIFIIDIGDGGAKQDKFTRDIVLLEQGVLEEPNNARYYFYLANSYFSTGQCEKAIQNYDKRIELGGWDQEVWYSFYQKGLCYKVLKEDAKAIDSFLNAFNIIPHRLENLYEIVKHYRENSKYQLSNLFYQLAIGITTSANRDNYLFYDATVYNYKLDYEYSIIAFYNGKDNVDDLIVKVLNNCGDRVIRNSVISNNKFYNTKLQSLDIIDYTVSGIKNHLGTFNSSSPSIIEYRGGYMMNVRLVNYFYNEDGYIELFNRDSPQIITINQMKILDSDFNELSSSTILPEYNDSLYIGVEDIRIYNRDNSDDPLIYFLGTGYNGKLSVCGGVYGTQGLQQYKMLKQTFKETECEKNWVYAKDNLLIYSWYPFTLVDVNTAAKVSSDKDMPRIFEDVRGSTCGYRVGNEIWFVTHIVSYEFPRHYYHMFVVLDSELNLLRYSAPFKISDSAVEYCLGLIVKEDKVILSYSEWDRTSKVAIYDRQYIDSKIKYTNDKEVFRV